MISGMYELHISQKKKAGYQYVKSVSMVSKVVNDRTKTMTQVDSPVFYTPAHCLSDQGVCGHQGQENTLSCFMGV